MCSRCLQYSCVVQGPRLSGTVNVNGIYTICLILRALLINGKKANIHNCDDDGDDGDDEDKNTHKGRREVGKQYIPRRTIWIWMKKRKEHFLHPRY